MVTKPSAVAYRRAPLWISLSIASKLAAASWSCRSSDRRRGPADATKCSREIAVSASSSEAMRFGILSRRKLALDLQMPQRLVPAVTARSLRRPVASTRRSARFETASRLLLDPRRTPGRKSRKAERNQKTRSFQAGRCNGRSSQIHGRGARLLRLTPACSPSVPNSH